MWVFVDWVDLRNAIQRAEQVDRERQHLHVLLDVETPASIRVTREDEESSSDEELEEPEAPTVLLQ